MGRGVVEVKATYKFGDGGDAEKVIGISEKSHASNHNCLVMVELGLGIVKRCEDGFFSFCHGRSSTILQQRLTQRAGKCWPTKGVAI